MPGCQQSQMRDGARIRHTVATMSNSVCSPRNRKGSRGELSLMIRTQGIGASGWQSKMGRRSESAISTWAKRVRICMGGLSPRAGQGMEWWQLDVRRRCHGCNAVSCLPSNLQKDAGLHTRLVARLQGQFLYPPSTPQRDAGLQTHHVSRLQGKHLCRPSTLQKDASVLEIRRLLQ